MLGLVDSALGNFVRETFGEETWSQVQTLVSLPSPAEQSTFDFIATKLLGATGDHVQEAMGRYCVSYYAAQGYHQLLSVLGSNVVEFLTNLNSLHSHAIPTSSPLPVQTLFFRCDKISSTSLQLHCRSSRAGLWPLLSIILRGLVAEYCGTSISIDLLHARGLQQGADHEVFLIRYPEQPGIQGEGEGRAAGSSLDLHPFHLLLDQGCRLLHVGKSLRRLFPDIRPGMTLGDLVTVSRPLLPELSFSAMQQEAACPFLLTTKQQPCLALSGQMILDPGSVFAGAGQLLGHGQQAMLFVGTPRCCSLAEMQACGLYLSDLPLHDASRDLLLVAEHQHIQAEIRAHLEQTNKELRAEKASAEALVERMSSALQHAVLRSSTSSSGQLSGAAGRTRLASGASLARGPSSRFGSWDMSQFADHLESLKHPQEGSAPAEAAPEPEAPEKIEILEALSEGMFGKVYRGVWRGTEVAVKSQVLPSSISRAERREQMAIMEAVISASLSHPNIVQTYTYSIQPLKDSSAHSNTDSPPHSGGLRPVVRPGHAGSSPTSLRSPAGSGSHLAATCPVSTSSLESTATSTGTADTHVGSVHGLEVCMVLELCDGGSLRDNLNQGIFIGQDKSLNYAAVLDTAIDTCQAMAHLHRENVLHSDLKSQNVMLKSSDDPLKPLVAKVGDFGLSVRMDTAATHLSCMFQGTMTHMAPEVLLSGRLSKAADVYSFGILLYETYTGEQPFAGVPRALLGHQVTVEGKRPVLPSDAPADFTQLVEQCWSSSPEDRPTFEQLLVALQSLRAALGGPTPPLRPAPGPALSSGGLELSAGLAIPLGSGAEEHGAVERSSCLSGQLRPPSGKAPPRHRSPAPPTNESEDSGESFLPSEDSLEFGSDEDEGLGSAETME